MSKRIRTIKRDMLDDEKTASLSDGAFRLWIGILLLADDHGRFRSEPRRLAATIWHSAANRGEPPQVAADLAALVETGLIRLYDVAGERFGVVTNWAKHQRIDNASRPEYPEPPGEVSPQFAANRRSSPLGGGVGEGEGGGVGNSPEGERARELCSDFVSTVRRVRSPKDPAPGLTPAPASLSLDDAFRATLTMAGCPDPDPHVEAFLAHSRATGKLYTNWLEAFRVWMLRERGMRRSRGRQAPEPTPYAPEDEYVGANTVNAIRRRMGV